MPNFLLANNHFIGTESVCRREYRDFSKIAAIRLRDISASVLFNRISFPAISNPCSIRYPLTLKSLFHRISSPLVENVSFIHEMGAHDEISYKASDYKRKLLAYDSDYSHAMLEIAEYLRQTRSADYLLVLSDHGPRTGFFGPLDADTMVIGSWHDKDVHSYFMYFIPLSHKKELVNVSRLLSAHFKSDQPIRYKYDFASQKLVRRTLLKSDSSNNIAQKASVQIRDTK
jgi:hypothetical protein